MISAILAKFLPFMAVAADADVVVPDIVATILKYVAGIGGGIVAIFLIVSLVKDAISYASGNGSGSVWKIIGKVLFLILIIGIIFLALNWQALGNTASDIGSNILDQGSEIVGGAVGGGTP